MKNLLLILILYSTIFSQSLWKENTPSPYSNPLARNIGDIIFINIEEYHMASQKADTQLRRDSSIRGDADLNWSQAASYLTDRENSEGRGGVGFTAENRFSGSGSTGRTSRLQADLTVRIYKIEDDRFFIRGSKTIVVNNEEEEISIEGIIRRSDIQANNSVDSSKIANVVLKLKGYGNVSRDQEKGFLSQLIDWIF
jgi:flagellar L-ring protein FlgH